MRGPGASSPPHLLEEFLASTAQEHEPAASTTSSGSSAASSTGPSPSNGWTASPLHRTRRRETDERLPFLFDRRPGPPAAGRRRPPSRQRQGRGRGPTYHAIFALCYGLGLRAGEACGLPLGDVDADRQLLVVRGGKFGKSRLVPHGPRIGELLARQVERRRTLGATTRTHRCSPSTVGAASTRAAPVRPSIGSWPSWRFPVPDGVSPPRLHCLRHSFAVGCLLRWYREDLDPADPALPALHLHGPRRPHIHRGLPDHHPATARRGQPTIRDLRRASVVGGDSRDRRAAARAAHPLLLPRPPDHGQRTPTSLGAQLPRHHPSVAVLRGPGQENEDHQARSEDLTFERVLGFLRYLENDAAQPRPHPQPTPGRPAHPVRLHRRPRTRDARRLPAGRRHPDETGGASRDPLPRTRRDRDAAAPPPPDRSPRPARPRPPAVPLQHRRHESRKSPTCASNTSTSANARWSGCTARATSGGPAHCGVRPPRS